MEAWHEKSEKVAKVRVDLEKAKALLKITGLREERLRLTPMPKFATLLIEDYYDIIKELITALMSVDGWKTTSHELLIGYVAKFYSEFTTAEITMMDQLRVIRNDITYRGIMIKPEFLERNQRSIEDIIKKLKEVLVKRTTKQI